MTEPITSEQLEELDRLFEGSTQGEWRIENGYAWDGRDYIFDPQEPIDTAAERASRNEAFAVAAHNLFPAIRVALNERCPAILMHPLAQALIGRILAANAPRCDPDYPHDVDLRLHSIITERDELRAENERLQRDRDFFADLRKETAKDLEVATTRVAELERERNLAVEQSIFAPNSCSVCGGQPLASGRECICGGKGTSHAEMDGLRQELFDCEQKQDGALSFIERRGYRRCDVPACNCGSWHGGHAEDRLSEIADELSSETQGTTILKAVKERRTVAWNQAIEIVGSFMTIHEEITEPSELVLNAKLREIIATLTPTHEDGE